MKLKTISIIMFPIAGALLGAISCSGTEGAEDVFSQGTNSGSSSSGTIGMGGAGGQGSASSSSSGGQSSSSSGNSSSSSSGMGGSGGGMGTGGTMGTGGSPPVAEIPCGNLLCTAGEICCNAPQISGNPDQCGMPGACPQGSVEVGCNDIEDCPGQMCCGNFQNGGYTSVGCYDQCGNGQLIMCEGHPEICPANDNCNPSQILGQGFSYCQ